MNFFKRSQQREQQPTQVAQQEEALQLKIEQLTSQITGLTEQTVQKEKLVQVLQIEVEHLTVENARLQKEKKEGTFPISLSFPEAEKLRQAIAQALKHNHFAFQKAPVEDCLKSAQLICAGLVQRGILKTEPFFTEDREGN